MNMLDEMGRRRKGRDETFVSCAKATDIYVTEQVRLGACKEGCADQAARRHVLRRREVDDTIPEFWR
ncbi:hypothetical protein B0H19DRAFT_1185335 [Mycena capillaripes]|nr:hypothetical protein B0H19DRAFT_1185335 [Mycena capillaripes]